MADQAELAEEIEQLKEERDAIILAHNYQLPEIQDIADFLRELKTNHGNSGNLPQ